MGYRYLVGNLAEEPETRQAGRVQIVTLTVLENTAQYQGGERIEGHKPLRHIVEAKFEMGSNVLASLHKGMPVIVVGQERDASFEGREGTVFRRVIDASSIGPDLARSTAVVTRTAPKTKEDGSAAPRFEESETPAEPAAEPQSTGSMWAQ